MSESVELKACPAQGCRNDPGSLPAASHEASAKHTPGPWSAEDSEIFSADAWRIAETCPLAGDCDPTGCSPAEHANARLIAAAPDLIASLDPLGLEFAADCLERLERAPRIVERLRVMAALQRAAIAKAEGRSC